MVSDIPDLSTELYHFIHCQIILLTFLSNHFLNNFVVSFQAKVKIQISASGPTYFLRHHIFFKCLFEIITMTINFKWPSDFCSIRYFQFFHFLSRKCWKMFNLQRMGVICFKQTTNNSFRRKKKVAFSRKNTNLKHIHIWIFVLLYPYIYFTFSDMYFGVHSQIHDFFLYRLYHNDHVVWFLL